MNRIDTHPILTFPVSREVEFLFQGLRYTGREGEPVTSALTAAGIHIFGEHPRDRAPQGLFCANGQCSQCTLLIDGIPVKGCMTALRSGMDIRPCIGKPLLPPADALPGTYRHVDTVSVPVLIIGGGPAGLSAAEELGKAGITGLLVDDRSAPGGKLVLQTHKFFGSRDACFAGVRGIDIPGILMNSIGDSGNIDIWTESPALGVFADRKVGILKDGRDYVLVEPEVLLIATGAREKNIVFPGGDLPGIMGAGAFQTLVNRDGVIPGRRLFIIGGGNVGLIVAYHAVQAGIKVTGLAEAMPSCGGYYVHEEKIKRLGVPVYTGHTVVRAEGSDRVSGIVIAAVDERGMPTAGTEKGFEVDTVLVAVGLSPVDELYRAARQYGMTVFRAGDAEEISEAGAAMFSGRILGRSIAGMLGRPTGPEPGWQDTLDILRKKTGPSGNDCSVPGGLDVYPVIRCGQQIPCNPCTEVCPQGAITIGGDGLSGLPVFTGEKCSGCGRCVLVCPGLAITLVDERKSPGSRTARVTLPWELPVKDMEPGRKVRTINRTGGIIGEGVVVSVGKGNDRCRLLTVEVPYEDRLHIASIVCTLPEESAPGVPAAGSEEDPIVCRCERIRKSEIVYLIRQGYRDMNSLKAALRVGMGACGGKTCRELVLRIFREEGVPFDEVTEFTHRPPLQEVPLSVYAGLSGNGERYD